jgi:chitinase
MTILPIIVAYFTAWSIYAPSYFVTNIPANKITHINYAFANISSNGSVTLGDAWADTQISFPGDTPTQLIRGNFNQLIKLKQLYPHLRTLISVGGYV